MTLRVVMLCLAGVLLVARGLSADVVQLRGTTQAITGTLVKADDAGVTIRDDHEGTRFIPWDRVQDVEPSRHDPSLERYLETADVLWRARSRVERHDVILAEPLLERLFEQYRGQTHETALVVVEGLLRCRLSRGAHDLAVIPALETARLYRAGVRTASYASLPPVFDERTSLCTTLAPTWAPSPSLQRLDRELRDYDSQGDKVIHSLAVLYRHALRQQLSMVTDDIEALAADHPGVAFLMHLVSLGSEDSKRRDSARIALSRDFSNLPSWAESWSHYFIGVSLLVETGEGDHERGMVHLLHLPARFRQAQPYLAGLALDRVAAELERSGDQESAASLRHEIQREYPNHPVRAGIKSLLLLPSKASG